MAPRLKQKPLEDKIKEFLKESKQEQKDYEVMPLNSYKKLISLFDEMDTNITKGWIKKDSYFFQKLLKKTFKHRDYVFDLKNKESKRLSGAKDFGLYSMLYL